MYVVCISVCMVCEWSKFIVCFVFCHKRIVKANMSFAFLAKTYLRIVDISTTLSSVGRRRLFSERCIWFPV